MSTHVIRMSFASVCILPICTLSCVRTYICHSYVSHMHSHVMCMSRMYLYAMVCHLYLLVCHPYVIRMYLYVICMSLVVYLYVISMSLVCTRISSICHSYLLASHPYVTHLWFYHEPCVTLDFPNIKLSWQLSIDCFILFCCLF